MTEHDLKTWPNEFTAVAAGTKRFEFRENDRGYEVRDVLILHEWKPSPECNDRSVGEYTGRVLRVHVTYILHGPDFGVTPGFVVMSILSDPLGEPWDA